MLIRTFVKIGALRIEADAIVGYCTIDEGNDMMVITDKHTYDVPIESKKEHDQTMERLDGIFKPR